MKEVIQEIENINNSFNYLVETIPIDENYDGDFITISIKDAILIKNSQARSSSKILNNYFPVNDSKVIKNTKDYFKNKNIKPIFIGKTIHDEFGFGGYNVNVGIDKKIPKNLQPLSKQGFSVNTVSLWKQFGNEICRQYLLDSRLVKDNWLNGDWIKNNFYKADQEKNIRYINKFFSLLGFEIWYRLFVTKEIHPNHTL